MSYADTLVTCSAAMTAEPTTTSTADLLATFEPFYDAVPRGRAHAEEIGPFTLFVSARDGRTTAGRGSA